jgi:hypothetical protein
MPQNPPPPLRPQPVRPASRTSPPPDPALQQRAWAALALAAISLFGLIGAYTVLLGSNPQRSTDVDGVAFVIAVVGIWLTATAMSRARRAGSARPRAAVFAMVLGIIGLVFTGYSLPIFQEYSPQLSQYVHCMESASTTGMQQACKQTLENQTGAQVGF